MDREEIIRRIRIGNLLIAMLEKDEDPRAPEVARILGEQRAELVERLEGMGERAHGNAPLPDVPLRDGPGDVVVGLRALNVKAKRL